VEPANGHAFQITSEQESVRKVRFPTPGGNAADAGGKTEKGASRDAASIIKFPRSNQRIVTCLRAKNKEEKVES